MNDITKHILTTLSPYLIGALFGVLICLMFRVCGGSAKVETVTIEKPKPVKTTKETPTSKGRFLSQPIPVNKPKGVLINTKEPQKIIHTNTPYLIDNSLLVDTMAIINTWLFERLHYDTTLDLQAATIRLRWENYQNVTENFRVDYAPKKVPLKWALGLHANAGLISNFSTEYTPLFGLGFQVTVKKSYFAANYGFNGSHYVGVGVGYNIIAK